MYGIRAGEVLCEVSACRINYCSTVCLICVLQLLKFHTQLFLLLGLQVSNVSSQLCLVGL